jgi:hypothetical protein
VRSCTHSCCAPATAAACGLQISTAPYDPRFPSTNQNRHCFIRYNEYYK